MQTTETNEGRIYTRGYFDPPLPSPASLSACQCTQRTDLAIVPRREDTASPPSRGESLLDRCDIFRQVVYLEFGKPRSDGAVKNSAPDRHVS